MERRACGPGPHPAPRRCRQLTGGSERYHTSPTLSPSWADALRSRSCGMKSDVDVGHLLGHAARGFGEQREVGGADAALVVQTPQPPLGPVDEVGTRAEPELAEALARRGRARLV